MALQVNCLLSVPVGFSPGTLTKKQQQWNGNNMRHQEILAEVRKVAVF
jgi:hypothetical protein